MRTQGVEFLSCVVFICNGNQLYLGEIMKDTGGGTDRHFFVSNYMSSRKSHDFAACFTIIIKDSLEGTKIASLPLKFRLSFLCLQKYVLCNFECSNYTFWVKTTK